MKQNQSQNVNKMVTVSFHGQYQLLNILILEYIFQ